MNDLILLAGCTLGGAILGAGIAWAVCYRVTARELRWQEMVTQDYRVRLHSAGQRLSTLKSAIPPKKPRENGTVAKIRRILEGEQSK